MEEVHKKVASEKEEENATMDLSGILDEANSQIEIGEPHTTTLTSCPQLSFS